MARPPAEVTMLIKNAGDLLTKVKLENPPTRLLLDPKTIKLATQDPTVKGKVKDLMLKGVKVEPSTAARVEHTFIPAPKQTENQYSKPLLGYRLRELRTKVLSNEVYSTPRPRPLRGVVATVFGGNGFLGNQVVAQLAQYGATVICPTRINNEEHPVVMNTRDFRQIKSLGDQGQVFPVVYNPTVFDEVAQCVERSQVVFNCIGGFYPAMNQSQSFGPEALFANLPRNIARACAMKGVQRLVHTSHINADVSSPIPFFKYKALGEEAVLDEFPNGIIIRPADIFGDRDNFTTLMVNLLKGSNWPIMSTNTYLLEGNEYVECQPVWVVDVARAMVRAAMREYTFGQTYQLPGPDRYKLIEVMRYIEAITQLQPSHVRVYSPLEAQLRFDRPGGENHRSWIDLHLRENVVPKPGVKTWQDLEIDNSILTKMENITGDWMSKAPYRDMPTGFDEELTDLSLPRVWGDYDKKLIAFPAVSAVAAVLYALAILFP
uniref:NDUFA9 n=1 Tax=Euglena gracilis TaxID=3039 RepID=UPI002FE4FB0A|eukprot:EG_transcript_8914